MVGLLVCLSLKGVWSVGYLLAVLWLSGLTLFWFDLVFGMFVFVFCFILNYCLTLGLGFGGMVLEFVFLDFVLVLLVVYVFAVFWSRNLSFSGCEFGVFLVWNLPFSGCGFVELRYLGWYKTEI